MRMTNVDKAMEVKYSTWNVKSACMVYTVLSGTHIEFRYIFFLNWCSSILEMGWHWTFHYVASSYKCTIMSSMILSLIANEATLYCMYPVELWCHPNLKHLICRLPRNRTMHTIRRRNTHPINKLALLNIWLAVIPVAASAPNSVFVLSYVSIGLISSQRTRFHHRSFGLYGNSNPTAFRPFRRQSVGTGWKIQIKNKHIICWSVCEWAMAALFTQ